MRTSSRSLKRPYWLVMGLTAVCITINIYRLLHPHFRSSISTILSIITPIVVVFYLSAVRNRRNKLLKKMSTARKFLAKIKKIFSVLGPGLVTGASDDDPPVSLPILRQEQSSDWQLYGLP